jgi:hypothetical protein
MRYRRDVERWLIACGFLFAACANAGDTPAARDDAPPVTPDTPITGPRACPPGELAVEVDALGFVRCASPAAPIKAAIDASCSVYLGWRDSCDNCALPPTKWGRAGATCTNVGLDNTCTTQGLGGVQVPLLGLNFDGDVNDDDKLYGSFYCAGAQAASSASPCPDGQFVTGRSGSGWACASIADIAVTYARQSCSLYLGWRDSCNGCGLIPSKWGYAGSTTCMNGAGVDNTCSTAVLGTETVSLYGLNFDGDVDDDDKLHLGLHCAPPSPPMGTPTTICPPGQFVVGTESDGAFLCASPMMAVHEYITSHCTLYAGARDGCDGCLTVPAKWGSAKVGSCMLGIGADNTCGKFTLSINSIDMFGLNFDGDVDGNDTVYVGLRCE